MTSQISSYTCFDEVTMFYCHSNQGVVDRSLQILGPSLTTVHSRGSIDSVYMASSHAYSYFFTWIHFLTYSILLKS